MSWEKRYVDATLPLWSLLSTKFFFTYGMSLSQQIFELSTVPKNMKTKTNWEIDNAY
jgi:hypothetical protein